MLPVPRICGGTSFDSLDWNRMCIRKLISYARLLNRVRTDLYTSDNVSMLQSRVVPSDDLVNPPFSSALHLLPTVEQCNRHKCLDDVAVNCSVYEITATHTLVECGEAIHPM